MLDRGLNGLTRRVSSQNSLPLRSALGALGAEDPRRVGKDAGSQTLCLASGSLEIPSLQGYSMSLDRK